MYFKIIFFLSFLPAILLSKESSVSVASIEALWAKQAYVQACESVYKFYHTHPHDAQANLYYGQCALYKGDVDKAMAAYDRAEILDETNALVHQYLGDLYAKIGNFEIAKGEYDKADRFGNAPVSRARLTVPDPHRLSVLLRLSAGSDDNVQYSAENTDLYSWYGDVVPLTSKRESTLFFKESLRLIHVYDSNPFSPFYYKTQLQIYNKNYETFHDEDLFQGDLYTGAGWGTNTFDVWLSLSYSHIASGYESYSDIYALHPQLRKRFENGLLLKLEASYELQRYRQWRGADKSVYSGKLNLSRWFGKNYWRMSYCYSVADKKDSQSQPIFIDKNYNEIDINYVRALTRTVEAGLGYMYRLSNYDDRVRISSGEFREDTLRQYSAYLSYDLDDNTGLFIQYDYYQNKSNYIPSQYIKNVLNGGIYFYY